MPPYTERKKKYIDNLKIHGKFEDYKKKRAKLEKERRKRLKEALAKLSVAKRNQVIEENRVKNRKGVQKFRILQKERTIHQSQLLQTHCNAQLVHTTSTENHQNEPLTSKSENLSQSNSEVNNIDSNNEAQNIPFTENQHEQAVVSSEVSCIQKQTSSTCPLENNQNHPESPPSTLIVTTSTTVKKPNEPLVSKSIDFSHS